MYLGLVILTTCVVLSGSIAFLYLLKKINNKTISTPSPDVKVYVNIDKTQITDMPHNTQTLTNSADSITMQNMNPADLLTFTPTKSNIKWDDTQ